MSFKDIYQKSSSLLSFEFFPPKQEEQLASTRSLMADLKGLSPDFMTVTYGAGGGTRKLTRDLVSYIHRDLKITAVAHLTCVGSTAVEIDTILDELKGEGIEHVLALRGDPPKGQTHFEQVPGGFANALELTGHIRKRGDFSIAVAGYPEPHREAASPQADLMFLKGKVEAGAELVITQLFFDVSFYQSFLEKANKVGIYVPIVPGIMPIASVAQIERMTKMCGASIPKVLMDKLLRFKGSESDIIRFGIDYAFEMSEQLLRDGAPGIHVYTLNRYDQARPLVARLRERGR